MQAVFVSSATLQNPQTVIASTAPARPSQSSALIPCKSHAPIRAFARQERAQRRRCGRWHEKIGTTGSDAVHGRRCCICLDRFFILFLIFLEQRQRPSALSTSLQRLGVLPSSHSGPSFMSGGHKSGFVHSRCSNCMRFPGLIKQTRALSWASSFSLLLFHSFPQPSVCRGKETGSFCRAKTAAQVA